MKTILPNYFRNLEQAFSACKKNTLPVFLYKAIFLSLMVMGCTVINLKAQISISARANGNWNAIDTWISTGNLTGTVTTASNSTTVTGSGTAFTTELAVGAKLYESNGTTLIGTVSSISSNTSLTLTANAAGNKNNIPFRVRKIPGEGDNVFIADLDDVDVTIPGGYAASCSSIQFGNANSKDGRIIFSSSSSSLYVNGNLVMKGPTAGANRELLVNTGTLTVNGDLDLGKDQTGDQSNKICKVTVTTGTVNVSGNLTFYNIAGSSPLQTQINMSGGAGVFNLGGNFILNNNTGTLTPGTTSTFNFNGTTTQAIPVGVGNVVYNNVYVNNTSSVGAILSAAVSTSNVVGNIRVQSGTLDNGGFAMVGNAGKTFEVANDATYRLTGTSGFATGFGTQTLGNTSTMDYSGTTQTIISGTFGTLKVNGSGTKSMAGNITLSNDVVIGAGAVLDVNTNNYSISLLRNWTNNGTFNARNGTVTFTVSGGGSLTSINGASSTSFHNLTVGNSNDVLVSGNPVIAGTLTINSGRLVITPGNTVHITSGNPVGGSGFNSNNMIETQVNSSTGARGYLRISNISGSMTFPVGTDSHFMPATVTPSSTSDFSVNVFPGATANGMPNGSPFNTHAKKKMVDAIWNVEKNSGTGPTTLQVEWPNSLKGSTFSGLGNGSIGLSHYNGTYWDPALGSGSQTHNTATRTGILSFSPFGAGENNSPLPLKFDVIKVYKKNSGNQVDWSSFTEINVSHYEIERSSDGDRFVAIAQKPATGNNIDKASYGWLDMGANTGVVFYRIKAVDLDGKLTYSSIVRIGINNTLQEIMLVQNPVIDKVVAFEISNLEKGNYDIIVFDRNGRRIYSMPLNHYGGSISHSFAMPATTSSGIFNLRLSGNGKKLMKKFIVK